MPALSRILVLSLLQYSQDDLDRLAEAVDAAAELFPGRDVGHALWQVPAVSHFGFRV